MNQEELKLAVGRAAAELVRAETETRRLSGSVLGVGTGSTANCFIDAIAPYRHLFSGAVASSEATRQRLLAHGFEIMDLNQVDRIPFYVDGADEIDPALCMIKGGGGALTREKIVAQVAETFVCIADASKQVTTLGRFPLPVEVIPMARALLERHIRQLGGEPRLRAGFVTDNGQDIVDAHGLHIAAPQELERQLNQIPGVVTNGLFALRSADILLVSHADGVREIRRSGR